MGRQLAGPVRIGTSKTWFARVTVSPKDRARAGCNRLTRSLKTTDKAEALKRWPLVHQELKRELEIRLGLPVTDRDQIRARVADSSQIITIDEQGHEVVETLSPVEQAEHVLNVRQLDPTNQLHEQLLKALERGESLVTWESLKETYIKRFNKRKGRQPAVGTLAKIDISIQLIKPYCSYPGIIDRTICREFINTLESLGKYKPTSIADICAGVSKLITAGIKTHELPLEVNPWTLVDWSAVTLEGDGYRSFDLKQELPQLIGSKYWQLYRLLIGTGLRYGELFNRNKEDLDGNMLIIRANEAANWRTKTSNSIRRVPLDHKAVVAFNWLMDKGLAAVTWNGYLNKDLRSMFEDRRIVLHSTRHTYKTLCRVNGVDINIGEEISGHAKSLVSKTSDGYGRYPDDTLINENQKVWDWLDHVEVAY